MLPKRFFTCSISSLVADCRFVQPTVRKGFIPDFSRKRPPDYCLINYSLNQRKNSQIASRQLLNHASLSSMQLPCVVAWSEPRIFFRTMRLFCEFLETIFLAASWTSEYARLLQGVIFRNKFLMRFLAL